MKSLLLRHLFNGMVTGIMVLATLAVLTPLGLIFIHIVKMGLSSLSLDFFTHIPKPTGEAGGGMANGLFGSAMLIFLSSCFGLPVGVLGAVYLTEFGGTRMATAIRFSADVLAGIPSIITGMVAYSLIVVPLKGFSALAGSVALALIMIPIVLRTTEEQLKMVPGTLREASLALGVPLWRTSLKVMLKSATKGVVTGILLAIARIAGDLQLCHRSLRRLAQAGLGRSAGAGLHHVHPQSGGAAAGEAEKIFVIVGVKPCVYP